MGSPNVKLSRRQVLGVAAGGVAGAVGFRYLTLQLPGGSRPVASASGPAGAWATPLTGPSGLASHLLRRATFGCTAAELAEAASMKYPDLVDMVINQTAQPLPAVASPTSYQAVVRAWYQHMATTPAQFPERMTLFWHGLLTSDYRKAARLPFVLQQNELYRSAGRGDFRTLINAVTYDPLMIRYLDLEESTAAAPNENYSRELMELFTLGVGNYTETDVREGARAFSGIRTVLVDATGRRTQPPKLKGSTPAAYAQAVEQLLPRVRRSRGRLLEPSTTVAARRCSAAPETSALPRRSTSFWRSRRALPISHATHWWRSACRIRRPPSSAAWRPHFAPATTTSRR